MAEQDDKKPEKPARADQGAAAGRTSSDEARQSTRPASGGAGHDDPKASGASDVEKAEQDLRTARQRALDAWEREEKAKAEQQRQQAIARAEAKLNDGMAKVGGRRRASKTAHDKSISAITAVLEAPDKFGSVVDEARKAWTEADKELKAAQKAMDEATDRLKEARAGESRRKSALDDAARALDKAKAEKAALDAEAARNRADADHARETTLADADAAVLDAEARSARSAAETAHAERVLAIEAERKKREEALKPASESPASKT